MATYQREAGCVRQGARINVEEDKPEQQRWHYLHPELFGATEKEAIGVTSPPAMTSPAIAANANQANLRERRSTKREAPERRLIPRAAVL